MSLSTMQMEYGQQLCIVGNQAALGSWDASRGLKLGWNDGHVWAGVVELEAGSKVEFKVSGQGAT